MNENILIKKAKDEKYLKLFLIAALSIFLVILPIMIFTGGYYLYYGDYNSQQIPFYIHAQDHVRSEGLGWDWYTDLGTDFIGSYSFYLLGSPFFWMTLPFPNAFVVFLMPLLLSVKHGIAAVTAYAYIRRFVRNKYSAAIGGMLYAFSGFQLYNIFFNHFQDVTALFPLMLIALEERVNNERRGFFAVTVAVMGILNYFFFAGQAVFLVIYFLLRIGSPDFKASWRKFFGVLLEAVLGVMIAVCIMLPAAMGILGNYRINERLYGLDLAAYSDGTRIPRIIQSFFMIPDVPARPNLFSSESAKWSSIGGYFPMFSAAGVIAFFGAYKKHWSKRIVIVCALCAFIPLLNSMFYAFNSSYYARWFYMPILIMAMMTAKAFDNRRIDMRPGIKICALALILYAAISLLPKKDEEGNVIWFRLAEYPLFFWLSWLVTAVALLLMWLVDKRRRRCLEFTRTAFRCTVVCCAACTATVVYFGVSLGSYPDLYIGNGIYGSENINIDDPKDNFFRIDISENFDNYPMFWGYPCMRAFQSTVSPSIMEFYPNIGVTRDVASRAPLDKYTVRGLFSVKYYFDKFYTDKEKDYSYDVGLPGFEYKEQQNGFYIYENKYWLPMGFTFDSYITESDSKQHTEKTRERSLLRAMVIPDDEEEKYRDIIKKLPSDKLTGLTEEDYLNDCRERARETCKNFRYDSDGFTADIELKNDKLVFFSVPFDKGWTAYVNDEPVDIVKANYGFMAVKANAGKSTIRFEYETQGLRLGLIISAAGAALLAVYLLIFRKKNKNINRSSQYYDYDKAYSCKAQELYLNSFPEIKDKKEKDKCVSKKKHLTAKLFLKDE